MKNRGKNRATHHKFESNPDYIDQRYLRTSMFPYNESHNVSISFTNVGLTDRALDYFYKIYDHQPLIAVNTPKIYLYLSTL